MDGNGDGVMIESAGIHHLAFFLINTQFTCFTGTNVQILTPEELQLQLLGEPAMSVVCFTAARYLIYY